MTQSGSQIDRDQCQVMLDACACLGLKKTGRILTQFYDRALRPAGIRSTQLPILVMLAVDESLSMGGLAERLAVDQTTLTRNLKPLEVRKLVRIDQGSDRRTKVAKLTIGGEEKIAEAMPLWGNAQAAVARSLGTQLVDLHSLLSRLLSDFAPASNQVAIEIGETP